MYSYMCIPAYVFIYIICIMYVCMYVCMYLCMFSSHGFEFLLLDKLVIFQICVEVVASVEEVPLPLLLCLVWIAHIMYVLYECTTYGQVCILCMYVCTHLCMYVYMYVCIT